MSHSLLSQASVPLGNITGIGNLGNKTNGSVTNTLIEFELLISNIIGFITIIAGLYFLFQIIIAGVNWMSAGGDKQRLETAQKRLQNSFIGLIVVVSAYAIVGLIGTVLGLRILSPALLLINLKP